MTRTDPGTDLSLPGFRHVLEAAFLFGAVGGIADVSYIISRNPDLGAEFLQAMRFAHAGVFITGAVFLAYLLVAFIIIRPIASRRKWPLRLSLAVLYFVGVIPAGAIVCRNLAMLAASESILVAQVKTVYYFMKYIWLLVPLSWAAGVWLARLRVSMRYPALVGRVSAYGLAATLFLILTPLFQQQYLLARANEYSEVTAGSESTIISLGIFAGALLVLGVAWWIGPLLARPARGAPLLILWLIFVIFPFIKPILAGPPTNVTPPSGNAVSGRRSNVILVSLDTVRYDDVGPFGSTIVSTPTLDALGREGICFDNAIVPMPLTGPSHISMFTGLEPDSDIGHGVKSNGIPLADNIPTLATILNDAGYRTGAIISGFPLAREASGLQRGFNYYHDIFNEGIRARFLPDQVWYLTVAKIFRRFFHVAALLPHGRTKPADKVTDEAIDWLSENSDKPFFLFVHYFDAHYLYAPPPPFDTMYMPSYNGPYKGRAIEWNALMRDIPSFTEADFDYYRALYRGEISFVDHELLRLMLWGSQNYLLDNTLVIVVSDHGESFEHGYYFSHSDRVYDSLVHVPLIIREPGLTDNDGRGRRIDTLIDTSDLFYTILAYLQVNPPRDPAVAHEGVLGAVEGWDHNLLGLTESGSLNGVDVSGKGETSVPRGWAMVTSQSYAFAGTQETSLGRFFSFRFPDRKLIYGPDAPPALPEFQYFKLARDPNEIDDLYPVTDWSVEPFPDAPEALREWASRQGAGLNPLDPRVRAQLKALGYIQEGTAPLNQNAGTNADE